MNQDIIQRIIIDFHNRPLPALTIRDAPLAFVRDMSLAIVGARRCGKTYRTYQFIADYLKKDGRIENICRIQFNDHRLSRMRREDLSAIDEAYYALYPEKRGKGEVYFIFDEIHRIAGWEDYILHLIEDPTQRVLITGSTSRLLRGDMASGLRGKNLPLVLYPFSFGEFIRHYGVAADSSSSRGQAHLRKMLRRYMQQGGFPGLLDLPAGQQIELLQTYWDTMVLRDIIEGHPDEKISLPVFSFFAQALIARTACPFTVRAIIRNMREAGLSFTEETAYKYLRFIEEAFIAFTVPVFASSERVRNRNYHKVYAIDWALAQAVTPGEGIDVTRQFENMIYLDLRRRGYDVCYYKTRRGYEIDFIALRKREPGQGRTICQVSYALKNEEVMERELRGLPETARHFGVDNVAVITMNDDKTLKHDGVRIDIVPAWKWLLDKK